MDAGFPDLEKAVAETNGMFMQPFIDCGMTPDVARIRITVFMSARSRR